MAFELGYDQADYLYNYSKELYPNSEVIIDYDLTGYKRFLFIIKN